MPQISSNPFKTPGNLSFPDKPQALSQGQQPDKTALQAAIKADVDQLANRLKPMETKDREWALDRFQDKLEALPKDYVEAFHDEVVNQVDALESSLSRAERVKSQDYRVLMDIYHITGFTVDRVQVMAPAQGSAQTHISF